MGQHVAPVNWLERWQDAEPVRLYLWTVAVAVLSGALVAGWVTRDLYVALSGVVSAVLMVGGTAAARRKAWAPRSVALALDDQHRDSFNRGVGKERARMAAEQRMREGHTVEMEALAPETAPRDTVAPCGHTDDRGNRCTLVRHPARVQHRMARINA